MGKKVLIIGSGIAGLCAGSYLKMNGYDVSIFEMSHTAGGLCTSWKKGDYTVDFCLHWLVGTQPESSFYKRWQELVDMNDLNFVNHKIFKRVEGNQGNYIDFYTSLDQLEKELMKQSPSMGK